MQAHVFNVLQFPTTPPLTQWDALQTLSGHRIRHHLLLHRPPPRGCPLWAMISFSTQPIPRNVADLAQEARQQGHAAPLAAAAPRRCSCCFRHSQERARLLLPCPAPRRSATTAS